MSKRCSFLYLRGCVGRDTSHNIRQATNFNKVSNFLSTCMHTSIHVHVQYFCPRDFHEIDMHTTFVSSHKLLSFSKQGGKCPWWLVLQALSELKVVCGTSGRPSPKGTTNPNTGVFRVHMGALGVKVANRCQWCFSLEQQCWDLCFLLSTSMNTFSAWAIRLYVQFLNARNRFHAKNRIAIVPCRPQSCIHAAFRILCAQCICLHPPSISPAIRHSPLYLPTLVTSQLPNR